MKNTKIDLMGIHGKNKNIKLLSLRAGILDQTRRRPPTTGQRPNNENLIINTLLKLKGTGLAESTLEKTSYRLTRLGKLCDLANPEETKLSIASLKVANSEKQSYV